MNGQKLIIAMAEWLPQSVKLRLRGDRGKPTWLANATHSIFNRMPGNRYPVLTCSGVLAGYRMRVDWTKHRCFAYGTWEPEVVAAITKNVSPGMTALDIGAHAGFYAILLSKLVGPDGQVVAFEPLPANFRFLQENVALNGIHNIRIQREAVGKSSGELDFEIPDAREFVVAGPLADEDPRGSMTVPVVSLDDFVFNNGLRVDVIKIDAEGAEGDILLGGRRTLETFHPALLVELHGTDKQPSRHPVATSMQELGYKVHMLTEPGYTAHTFAQWPAKAASA
jgi:FkbM family methyltransferase